MPVRLTAVPILLVALVAGAGSAVAQGVGGQGVGGQVVDDPYSGLPRIRLDQPGSPVPAAPATRIETAPLPVPRTAVPPPALRDPPPVYGRARPLDPVEALGLVIDDALLRELDNALSGRPGRYDDRYRYRERWRYSDDDPDDDHDHD